MTVLHALPLIGLTLLGALSPLLTFAALFQQKEWRLDRLREHLRRDGWAGQLFGRIRPLSVLVGLLLLGVTSSVGVANVWLFAIAGLSIVQIALRKQRYPRPTSKAMTLLATALLLDTVLITLNGRYSFLYILTLLQPFVLMAAWLLWKPVDFILKKQVMDRATRHRSQMENVTVIGIAGSVGKTTVKELIAHLLQDLKPLVTPAHVNTEMGVAQWLLNNQSIDVGARHAVPLLIIEMGAYRKGEIALLCDIAQPTIGVMTALGSDHVALFGSEEAIVEANGELIAALPSSGHAFMYGENKGCQQLAKTSPCPITLTGSDNLKPTHIKETETGLEFSLGAYHYKVPLHGMHNLHNAILAIAVARHVGINDTWIIDLLKNFRPQAHTFSVQTEGDVSILDDTYNISPLSVGAALDWAATRKERPRVLLTSGLQETGSDEETYLRELGKKAAKSVERVIFTDAHGAQIFEKTFGKPVEILSQTTDRVAKGSLILAVGRMPLSTIQRLLPEHRAS